MDPQPIHSLAAVANANGLSKQHPMQLHHTLQHNHHNYQQQQPLISSATSQHQMLQFHHQAMHHPYSTLHHHSNSNATATSVNTTSPNQNTASHTMHFAHSQNHLAHQQQQLNQHQQQQQQQHQQQQYNMNSDYSSSTYHIYDQISDLIIIKQQRMERKRQLEHRRKVILLCLAAILLVGTLMFLAIQSFWSTSASSLVQSELDRQAIVSTNGDPNLLLSGTALPGMPWAPPIGSPKSNFFDGASFGSSSNSANLGSDQLTRLNNKVIMQQQQQPSPACSNRGQIVISEGGIRMCKCDPGFWGDRCQELYRGPNPTSFSPVSDLQSKCLLTNCNNNGQCNEQGQCQCFPGYIGPKCEFKLPHLNSFAGSLNDHPDSSSSASSSSFRIKSSQHSPNAPHSVITQPVVSPTSVTESQCALNMNNCNGNGQCMPQGQCKCLPGFIGDACQLRDLCFEQTCSNQGICLQATGSCQCKFGFKGRSCEIRDDEQWQRLLNCSNHGKFDYVQRKCSCDAGFAGLDCSEERCELTSEQQLVDCGQNGLFDCRQNKCICQDGYSGDRCQIQQCSPQCLRNGQCVEGACICQVGFYGKHCSLNGCPNQCSGRGQCVRATSEASLWLGAPSSNQQQQQHAGEWRCQCQPGSTGDDCGILVERQCDDGIDNDRDGLIDCADSECCSDKVCQNSTLCMKSPDPLDILMRKQPPPPTSSFFQRMQFLIEKFSSQIYSNSKDFNDSSLMTSKNVDRASVIRGRVTYLKQGITGVRVSVAGQINLGITLTRDGGYFDLMVNGGGAVVVEFRREPFATHQRTVRVPWNEIVLMDPVELLLDSSSSDLPVGLAVRPASPLPEPDVPICSAHNYRLLRPQIVAGSKSSRHSHVLSRSTGVAKSNQALSASSVLSGQQTSRAVILRDSAIVQQTIALPNSSNRDSTSTPNDQSQSSVSLVYTSSRASEFMSTINIQLTPLTSTEAGNQFKLSDELKLIHLKIVIEGNLFEQLFEPQTNLSFTYAWNRRNVYRQKSFGLSTASVSVGYEYYDCKHVIWSTEHVQLAGHDLSISDIGNQWNLNIHHRYNYRNSILQRGDGQNFNLKTEKPRVVLPVMGDGYQRQSICPYCDGSTNPSEQRLLKPQALVSGHDGSLYIGDYNLIRRIESPAASGSSPADRVVRTVLEMPTNRVPSKYNLALNLADQRLYMSDADRYQIYLIREQANKLNETVSGGGSASPSSSEESLLPVVGSGIRCQLDNRANCGDGQTARGASLFEPKAFVFDLSGRMYIADGPNVRMVDVDQKIYTILGDYGATRHTKFPCSGEAIQMHKFFPRGPVDLAMSPIDDTLHILDDNVVYKITQDKRVQIVAGRLSHCMPNEQVQQIKGRGQLQATEVFLQSAQSIAFNHNGDLFISEDDQKQQISRVLLVSPEDDTISLYAGLLVDASHLRSSTSQLVPTVDSVHLDDEVQQQQHQQLADKQRSSNVLPMDQPRRAVDHKFSSVGAIAVDQQGNLIVADKVQLKVLSIEPDLPQINSAGEYEIQSPDNSDELLIFNRHGHHVATREISSGQGQRNTNKYTFSYNVNTSFGQLASISFSNGNKLSIYRDGPHHSVKMIETAFGGQCKLDISRSGQVHSISIVTPNSTKTSMSYHIDGGLLKQSRDQASGEVYDFAYDEFGRATLIQHSSPRLAAPVECHLAAGQQRPSDSQQCAALIVTE